MSSDSPRAAYVRVRVGPMSDARLASLIYGLVQRSRLFHAGARRACRGPTARHPSHRCSLGAVLMSAGHLAMSFDPSFLIALLAADHRTRVVSRATSRRRLGSSILPMKNPADALDLRFFPQPSTLAPCSGPLDAARSPRARRPQALHRQLRWQPARQLALDRRRDRWPEPAEGQDLLPRPARVDPGPGPARRALTSLGPRVRSPGPAARRCRIISAMKVIGIAGLQRQRQDHAHREAGPAARARGPARLAREARAPRVRRRPAGQGLLPPSPRGLHRGAGAARRGAGR